jgi:hypothetical protein
MPLSGGGWLEGLFPSTVPHHPESKSSAGLRTGSDDDKHRTFNDGVIAVGIRIDAAACCARMFASGLPPDSTQVL